jgi:catechol 2,3-dioxygenase-like lactoylglutathione lyase family enzyme
VDQEAMSIKTLSHIGIGVRDIEESVDFYCDVFGMYVLYRHEFREHPETSATRTSATVTSYTWRGTTRPTPSS